MTIRPERLTVDPKQRFVVFLIGARINHWWMLPVMWGVARAFDRMMRELVDDPDSGLLSYESYGGRTSLNVQYWRSYEDLQRYARSKERAHVPAWRRWLKEWSRGAVGIWHETYVIEPGQHECIYQHMPAFGLGSAFDVIPAEGKLNTGPGRRAAGAEGEGPAFRSSAASSSGVPVPPGALLSSSPCSGRELA